jgi:hypothetical protein
MAGISQSQFLVTLKGIDCYWEKFSGIKEKADSSDYSDGLSNRLYKLRGPKKLDDMDLEKAFDPIKDKFIIDWWQNYCEGTNQEETVTVTPIVYCPRVEPIGASLIIYGVKPIGLEGFEADKKSNDVSMLKLTICADSFTYS